MPVYPGYPCVRARACVLQLSLSFYNRIFNQFDVDRMTNIMDPDQTAMSLEAV